MQPITRELQAVTFLLGCNIFTVQPRNFNDGNTLTPAVGLQPSFATGREIHAVPARPLTRTTPVVQNNISAMLL